MRYFCLLLPLLLFEQSSKATEATSPPSPSPYPLVAIRVGIREIDATVVNDITFTQSDVKEDIYIEASLKPGDLISFYDKGKDHSGTNLIDRLKSISFIDKTKNAGVELTKDEKEGDNDFATLYNQRKNNENLTETIDNADELKTTLDVYPCYYVSNQINQIIEDIPIKAKDKDGNDFYPDGQNVYSLLLEDKVANFMQGVDVDRLSKEYEEKVDEVTAPMITDPTREDREFQTFLIENYKLVLGVMFTIGALIFLGVYLLPSPSHSKKEQTSPPEKRRKSYRDER